MSVAFYLDVHVPQEIADQLRSRGVDVLTVIDDGRRRSPDQQLLERATELNRVLVTEDVGFKVLAERWQARGKEFSGVIFCPSRRFSVGGLVGDLHLIAEASEPDEWRNRIEYLPFRRAN